MKPNRRSIRLPGYDYASAGWYFVTICCHKRQNLFGEIRQGEMALNAAGEMVEECWFNIPKHFPNTVLHEFVVMPNHVHGIIELTVGAENFLPLQPIQHEFQAVMPISVASIVKGFKIGVTWNRFQSFPDDAGAHSHLVCFCHLGKHRDSGVFPLQP